MISDMQTYSPEEIGIKTVHIENFLDTLEEKHIHMHSFLIMRNGKIGAECYWKPFTKDTPHRMYSVTKSFVAIAIGLLADEGKLSLDDKTISFFPELVPPNVHQYISDASIEDLLTMSTMYSKPTYDGNTTNWLESYFTSQPDHPSGTIYHYDSCGTYVLAAIVKRVIKKNFDEYLDEKIFKNLGFAEGRRCLEGPDGERWAGSGLIITTRELAAFANLLLNKGCHNGKQLISESFVCKATARHRINRIDGSDYSYWCGYGYQIWILKDNAFCFNGMGGQLAIAFPKTGLVFACTADVQGNPTGKDTLFNALWDNIVSKLQEPMDKDEVANSRLIKRCKNAEMHPFEAEAHCKTEQAVNGKTYILNDNPMKISDITLRFFDSEGIMEYTTPRGRKKLNFGLAKFKESLFPETHYPGEKLGTPANRMYKCLNSASWADEKTLIINSYIIDDYIGNLTITIGFKNDEVGIYMQKHAQFFLDEYSGYAGGKVIKKA